MTDHHYPKPSSSGSSGVWFARVIVGFPLAVFGGCLTLIFCLFVGGYIVSRVGGGPPLVNLPSFFLAWFIFGAMPLGLGILLLQHSKGTLMRPRVFLGSLIVLVLIGIDTQCGPKNWRGAFRPEKKFKGPAAQFKGTFVTAHLDEEIQKGTNLVWCGTFQLAWNEACRLAGGDLQLAGLERGLLSEQPMAAALNKHTFTKDSIDDASHVAMAGFVKDDIHNKIRAAVKARFKDGFTPGLIPDKALTPRAQDFVAYACLWKKLSFPVPFERLEDSLQFGGVRVRAFGIGKGKAQHEQMYPQVKILDYQNENDFVIELKTKSDADRLILAKVKPQGTLAETTANVRHRAAQSQPESAGTNDVLIVPRINLDIVRKYFEIENHWLVPLGRKVAPDLLLMSAEQSIRFELDEKGVELRSEAHMAFGCGREQDPVRKHIMVFDQPFLVLLERTGAASPYFCVWVDNPELCIPW